MKSHDADLGELLYAGPAGDDGEAMFITEDRHEECGWPERITYVDGDDEITRSGCAGCEAERPVTPKAGGFES